MQNIEDLIPHRPPFLFVDKLTSVDEKYIVGEKTFRSDEFFFKGHFPSYPIVPGVLLVEAMAQCGGAGINALNKSSKKELFFLASIEKTKFRQPVFPDVLVRFEIENVRITKSAIHQKGVVRLGDSIAAEASWLCIKKEVTI